MMDKKTYKKELVRMWDENRSTKYSGLKNCIGINCYECPIKLFCNVLSDKNKIYDAFEIIEAVASWSKEHK